MKEHVLFEENGVTITSEGIRTAKGSYDYRNIKRALIVPVRPPGLLGLFKAQIFRVVVDDFKAEHVLVETKDHLFAYRIKDALANSAAAYSERKQVRGK